VVERNKRQNREWTDLMEQVGSESERPKRALILELATLRPASFGIRTTDSCVNGYLRLLLNRIHLKS